MTDQYVAIFGDQSETQECFGPFSDISALFDFAEARGVAVERVSFYKILPPASWEVSK